MYQGKRWFLSGLLCVLIVFMFIVWINQAQSEEKYPNRAINLICPTPPGGAVDLSSRIIAAYLKKSWGVPVNLVNKPGGNSVPASLEVHQADPDGYTLMADSIASTSMMVILKDLPFKIMDRTFIGMHSIAPITFIVNSKSPIKSMKDLEAEVKKDPGNFRWASTGGASSGEFGVRQFFKAIGVDATKTKPVMASGGAGLTNLAAGGHVVMAGVSPASVLPTVKAGLTRVLAVTGKIRYPGLPDVPTTAELGYPTVDVFHWNCISGPPKLPSYIVDIWAEALEKMLKDPEVIQKILNIGQIAFYKNSSELRKQIVVESEGVATLLGLK